MHPADSNLFRDALLFVPLLAVLPFVFFWNGVAYADNWRAQLNEAGAPGHVVGVDKKNRTFNFFEKKSPIKIRYSYPCVTGQIHGDKQQINDLRTPEGVYFVEYKIASGLDFREYGGIAYTLNYPNPVDRLRGKTGHGIWIHSKGFELVPTRGCVAIDLRDIEEVGPMLTPGTPVILAEELKFPVRNDQTMTARLRALMSEWSAAWANRSATMFNFYDSDAYSKATENFEAFKKNKERLFKILSFIKIYNREIHVLEGPGYWVTWSEQFYTASNLSTEGIRRLYWQKGQDGKFRIVGMEWTPRDVGMRAEFLQGRLVAEGPVKTASDATSEIPTAPRLDMPEQGSATEKNPIPRADLANMERNGSFLGKISSGLTASIAALSENLAVVSEPLIPARQPRLERPEEIIWGTGKSLIEPQENENTRQNEIQTNEESGPESGISGKAEPQATDAANQKSGEPSPSAENLVLDGETLLELEKSNAAWESAYRKRDPGIMEFYDQAQFNRLKIPGAPRGRNFAREMNALKREFKQPWLMLVSRKPVCEAQGQLARCRIEQMIINPAGIRQGALNLWWSKDRDGYFQIVGQEFKPELLGLEANYLENVSNDIASTLESWRKAWEMGDIDGYMSFYAPDARQQGKTGRDSIRRQKEQLWARVKPTLVRLSGIRLAIDGRDIRADMNQSYADSAGHSDKGVKTLLLRFNGQKWLIQREDWINNQKAKTNLP